MSMQDAIARAWLCHYEASSMPTIITTYPAEAAVTALICLYLCMRGCCSYTCKHNELVEHTAVSHNAVGSKFKLSLKF